MKTLVDLSNKDTLIVMSYEQRSTGDKPEVEKAFFQVRNSPLRDTSLHYLQTGKNTAQQPLRIKYLQLLFLFVYS